MTEFFKTIMGKKFFDYTLPNIAKSLDRIANELEKQNQTKHIEPLFLIWCHERSMYWRSNKNGYTNSANDAGLYKLSDAIDICKNANLNGIEESIIPYIGDL